MRTSKKKEIWDQVIGALSSKISKGELRTWFSHTSLRKLDSSMAIIDVPNKFVATWLSEHYLTDLKKLFKRVGKNSPGSIHFSFVSQSTQESRQTHPRDPFGSLPQQKLNPFMTFETFLTGDCNRFAGTSAQAVSDHSLGHYSLLYIYSDPGLGKTHLLNAIGNHRLRKDPCCSLRYLSSDAFSSDFTYAINNEKLEEFRAEHCNLDLLLFDDIHLLARRQKTQEEFLFLFNSLYGNKKQMVITGDAPPNKLKNISSELRSRLGWGLLADMQLPDQKIKMEVIKAKASENRMDIPDDVAFFLANSNSDIKTIVKNLIKLETYSSINEGKITISMVKALTRDKERGGVTLEDIMNTTAGYFNIAVADLISGKKNRLYSYPRQLAMYLARSHTPLPFKEIGESFGRKDHSTVIYAIKRIERLKAREKKIGNDLEMLESLLG
jgi:chromosomal replication initiator protein